MKATLKAGDAYEALLKITTAVNNDRISRARESEEIIRLINNASTPPDLSERAKNRLKVLEEEMKGLATVDARLLSLGRQLGAVPADSIVELSAVEMVLFSYGAP